MRIDVLTLFPKMFENILGESILKRAQQKGLVDIKVHNLRDWTSDTHKTADDKPFGGGAGMVLKVEPVYKALEELKYKSKVILLTPQGKKLDQQLVKKLAKEKRLILICGHYEGVDERVRELADEEISIGDYILTCGEIPALVIIDSVARLIPGVLGHDESTIQESFEDNLLEYPQYTRPADFVGMKVPEILLSGNHKKIEEWRKLEAIKRTAERRPDLLKRLTSKTYKPGL
ncbi:MAG: tRNA (guanosine(37)-N1)-methyltransferase TrmD [Candidatus Omnitrophota bacterium]|nr:tRNA (guanosine(37)-N1)-methyltransferase TrmD [Candidatus Omnitrophota bacterium]